MSRDLLLEKLQGAVTLEDKFIFEFGSFFKEHVLDNYHLADDEKAFVEKRVKILFVDSQRHLGLFKNILEEVLQTKDPVV